jgi:hypothetical protein
VSVKRRRTQRLLTAEKESSNEQDTGLLSDEIITNPPSNPSRLFLLELQFLLLDGQSTFTTLEPVPLDLYDNLHYPPSSPPPLIIDSTEEMISAQSLTLNRNVQNRLNEKYNPSRTPFGNNKTKKPSSNNATRPFSNTTSANTRLKKNNFTSN